MDHLLDHGTAETEWITYNKKSADDLTHKSEKRTERGVFQDSNHSELVKLGYDFILRPLCDSKNRILSLLKSQNMFFFGFQDIIYRKLVKVFIACSLYSNLEKRSMHTRCLA